MFVKTLIIVQVSIYKTLWFYSPSIFVPVVLHWVCSGANQLVPPETSQGLILEKVSSSNSSQQKAWMLLCCAWLSLSPQQGTPVCPRAIFRAENRLGFFHTKIPLLSLWQKLHLIWRASNWPSSYHILNYNATVPYMAQRRPKPRAICYVLKVL